MELELHAMEFSAVHFIIGHEKCGRLHGHNWKLSVSIEGIPGDSGMMIDFGDLKKILKKIIEKYDHGVLIPERNKRIKFNKIGDKEIDFEIGCLKYIFPKEDCVFLPIKNTTCEELAVFFRNEIYTQLKQKKFKLNSLEVFVEEKDGQGVRYGKNV